MWKFMQSLLPNITSHTHTYVFNMFKMIIIFLLFSSCQYTYEKYTIQFKCNLHNNSNNHVKMFKNQLRQEYKETIS